MTVIRNLIPNFQYDLPQYSPKWKIILITKLNEPFFALHSVCLLHNSFLPPLPTTPNHDHSATIRWKKQFKKLLDEAGFVTPGKQLSEVRVLFMGRECFEALSEHDCQQIYDNHQKEIVDRAKHNFQELLLEHADLFYHFKSIEPSGTITQDDVKDITDVLQDDVR